MGSLIPRIDLCYASIEFQGFKTPDSEELIIFIHTRYYNTLRAESATLVHVQINHTYTLSRRVTHQMIAWARKHELIMVSGGDMFGSAAGARQADNIRCLVKMANFAPREALLTATSSAAQVSLVSYARIIIGL